MNPLTGGLNNYYLAEVKNPQRDVPAYIAECEDIIQALGMTFDEGCLFKALWRSASARLGNGKLNHNSVYDAEKMAHYANRILKAEVFKRDAVVDAQITIVSVENEALAQFVRQINEANKQP